MAINKKGKRKIVVNSKTYLWWFFNEYDQTTFDGKQIRIIAEDQTVCLGYGLEQKDNKRIIRFVFNRERGIIHIECPKFENDLGIMTPSGISELIKWASIKSDEIRLEK